ncbi:hypothetical protein FFLO_05028 [Filobasidium floriforme]|uniref:Uncharacterized protein n=1 Tax=Filobasidium floriforme TaxID=5210 RepID=A0A8K0JHQ5_9TREE|nr:uncharacterized protein HD553DRAFT_319303 [Filobasidium floriforme]KAG7530429.1 hypothetical protein FFLO_05028 [Filobasidium floriforme]KAH8078556.1 hypothetical protein HD553DRAFT_319303 [Filobasidium floriforme]
MFLSAAVNAIQGPVIYVYMSDTPQGEAHPFWREINSQPKVAAAHYMAYDVDNRDHYAAQPEKYFWVKDGIRSDRLQVTQSEEGGAQDPVIFSTGEHASRRDLSHSVSQTLDRSSSQDEQTVEAELDRVETETSTRPSIEDGHSSSQRQDTVEAALDAVQLSAEHIEDVSQQIHQPARSVTAELNDSADLAGALASLVVNSTSSGEPAVSHRETGLGSSMSDRLSNLIRRSQRPAYTVEFDPQVHHYPLPDSFRAAEIRWIYKVYPNGTRSDAFFFNNIVLKYRNQSDVRLTQGWSDNRVYLEDFVTIGIPLRVYEKLLTKLRALFSREGVDPKLPDTDGESHYAWLDVKLRRDARYQFFVPDSSGRTLGPLRYLAERTHRLETKHLVGRGQLALRVNHVPGLSPRLGGTLWGFDHASCVDIGSGSILR